jgi:cyclopropane fatty-acyl-phospholipid synthase-like methyltransferase
MRAFDHALQMWRIRMAAPWIPEGSRVLDIGCADGALFRKLSHRIVAGSGLDPTLTEARELEQFRLLPGVFPATSPVGPFDVVTMLAVLEHVPQSEQTALARKCAELLPPRGRVIVTVPQPAVDHLLALLIRLRISDGMSVEEHYGFDPRVTRSLFEGAGLEQICHRRFQLGLNNLYVFQKPAQSTSSGLQSSEAR